MTATSDLSQGTLDPLILKVVALGPVHGYAIVQRLQQFSCNVVPIPHGVGEAVGLILRMSEGGAE
jgi:PadR family transcriptional regulator PadR